MQAKAKLYARQMPFTDQGRSQQNVVDGGQKKRLLWQLCFKYTPGPVR